MNSLDFYSDDQSLDNFEDVNDGGGDGGFSSDGLVEGDGTWDVLPTISDSPSSSRDSGSLSSSVSNILGSIGTTLQQLPATARSLGTAVGTAKHDLHQAQANYTAAEHAASTGNGLSTWWQYASTTDKLMVGLAVVGIFVALKD